ncbi:MAG: aminotransferase class III-fold pyridoxal phosphate-dependent enzyme, partial [Bacteroidales bacterium]
GGMPISAFIASEALMELLQKEHPLLGHATTFGGHPLSCVASLATLNILLEDSFLNKVNEKGERIRQHLQEIPEIVEVKGRGLFLSAWFKDSDTVTRIVERCIQNGFISLWLLFNHRALALTPPLTITNEEIDEGMRLFKKSIAEAVK